MVITTPLTGTPYERLYNFSKSFLGYDRMDYQPHWEMCEFLENAVKPLFNPVRPNIQTKSMMLVPRGCFKTTIGSVALPIWLLIQLPNLRILIDSHTRDFAQEILQEIKDHLENPKFIEVFGDWSKDSQRWAAGSIIINRRTEAKKEGSIDTCGIDKSKTGGHYDLIIPDDVVDEKGISEVGVKKTRRHFNRLVPILEPNGCQLVIGTRWSYNDVYGFLMENDRERVRKERSPEYSHTLWRGAWNDGKLYFPAVLDEEFLARAKMNMTNKEFAVWYMNDPVGDEEKVFPRSMIRYYHPSPDAATPGGFVFERESYLEVVV